MSTATSVLEPQIFINSKDVKSAISLLDQHLVQLQTIDKQGDYIKFDSAMDILLDVRNTLQVLLE